MVPLLFRNWGRQVKHETIPVMSDDGRVVAFTPKHPENTFIHKAARSRQFEDILPCLKAGIPVRQQSWQPSEVILLDQGIIYSATVRERATKHLTVINGGPLLTRDRQYEMMTSGILAADWDVYLFEAMTVDLARRYLDAGFSLSRPIWDNRFIYRLNDRIVSDEYDGERDWVPDQSDFLASDWFVMENGNEKG